MVQPKHSDLAVNLILINQLTKLKRLKCRMLNTYKPRQYKQHLNRFKYKLIIYRFDSHNYSKQTLPSIISIGLQNLKNCNRLLHNHHNTQLIPNRLYQNESCLLEPIYKKNNKIRFLIANGKC